MEWRKRIVVGLEIGSFVYLLLCLFNQEVVVTPNKVLMVFLISTFVGAATVIFDSEKFSFAGALLLHYLLVTAFVTLSYWLFSTIESLPSLLLNATMIYFISYLVTVVKMKLTANKLNHYLNKLNQKTD